MGASGTAVRVEISTFSLASSPPPSISTCTPSGTITVTVPKTLVTCRSISGPGKVAWRKSRSIVPNTDKYDACCGSRSGPRRIRCEQIARKRGRGASVASARDGAPTGRSRVSSASSTSVRAATAMPTRSLYSSSVSRPSTTASRSTWMTCRRSASEARIAGGDGLSFTAGNTKALRGCCFALAGGIFDRHTDHRAVLGPGPVVVLDVAEAEQLLEHEPRVRRALADAAVRNHVLVRAHALVGIELFQLFDRFERAVLVGRLRPRDVGGAWHVASALRGLSHAWRRDDLAVELGR